MYGFETNARISLVDKYPEMPHRFLRVVRSADASDPGRPGTNGLEQLLDEVFENERWGRREDVDERDRARLKGEVGELLNLRHNLRGPGGRQRTTLHDAIYRANSNVVKFLLDWGADPTIKGAHKYAHSDHDVGVVEMLGKRVQEKQGSHDASRRGGWTSREVELEIKILEYLFEHGLVTTEGEIRQAFGSHASPFVDAWKKFFGAAVPASEPMPRGPAALRPAAEAAEVSVAVAPPLRRGAWPHRVDDTEKEGRKQKRRINTLRRAVGRRIGYRDTKERHIGSKTLQSDWWNKWKDEEGLSDTSSDEDEGGHALKKRKRKKSKRKMSKRKMRKRKMSKRKMSKRKMSKRKKKKTRKR